MKSKFLFKTAVALACAFTLAVALGCSSGGGAGGQGEGSSSDPQATSAAPAPETSSVAAPDTEAQTSVLPAAEDQQTEPAPVDTSQVTAENAADMGFQVFEGTIRVCSAEGKGSHCN